MMIGLIKQVVFEIIINTVQVVSDGIRSIIYVNTNTPIHVPCTEVPRLI
jgi:hypothetical protein